MFLATFSSKLVIQSSALIWKSLRVYWGQPPPAWSREYWQWGGLWGSPQGEALGVYQDNVDLGLVVTGKGLNTGTMEIVPLALVLNLHNSSCVFLVPFWAAVSPQELEVSACEQEFVCWPFKRIPVFSAAFCHTQRNKNSWWFLQSNVKQVLLFITGVWGWGIRHGAETLHTSGGTSAAEISLQILNCHMGVWG